MGNYLKLLDDRITSVKNQKIAQQLSLYRDFIQDLVKGEGLLDKKVYVVIPFSQLELGPATAAAAQGQAAVKNTNSTTPLNERVKSGLIAKRNNVLAQVERMGLIARPLGTDELIKLFYEVFNQEFVTLDYNSKDIKNVIL